MATLHLLNKPSLEHDASIDCMRALAEGDGLMLIEDGVYLTRLKRPGKKSNHVYALQHDLHVRGLSPKKGRINILNDADFVELCTKYDNIVSWF